MKILQINKYFYKKGGAETVFFNTIKLLERNGHTVIPFCLKNEKNESSPYESYFVNYPELSETSFFTKLRYTPSFIYNQEAAKKLEKLIIKEKPDIAHIHLLFNSLSVSILPILKKYNIPIVMSVHDYRLVCPAYTFKDGKGSFCEKCATKHYYNCILNKCSKGNFFNSLMLMLDSYFRDKFISPINYIDFFIFVSRFSRDKHIQIEPCFNNKSTYLYNFTPSVENIQKEKGKYILYFGRISEEKGIITLIKAIKDSPSIQLKIIGTGPLLEELRQCNVTNIEFLGFKKGEQLINYIRNALYTIVPSECYENNPMTIIESYTLGTPVIASNIGGIPELIQENKTGFLFKTKSSEDLLNQIKKGLLVSEEQYNNMSELSKTYALQNFSEKAHYNKLIYIYKQLLNKKSL